MIHKKLRKEQDDNNLGKLCRLESKATDLEPSGSTSCIGTEKTDSQKHNNVSAIHDPLEIKDPGIIDQRQNYHNDQSKKQTNQLLVPQICPGTGHKHHSNGADGNQKQNKPEVIKAKFILFNHMLISVMICYDFSFEISVLNNEFSILIDILTYNHRNLIIIYEHILSKISSDSMSNIWVYKLKQLVNTFNQMDNSNYISNDGRILNPVEKIMYNVSVIVQNIRVLLKNYKTSRIEYLTSIFKKIGEKNYEEINSFFRDHILRVDNVKGSVLASVFLKENQYFKTEPAPYIKTKNRKPQRLI